MKITPSIDKLFTLYKGSAFITNKPIKICADGSTSTYFKINVSNPTGITFRIIDEFGNVTTDVSKYGTLGSQYIFGNNIEVHTSNKILENRIGD